MTTPDTKQIEDWHAPAYFDAASRDAAIWIGRSYERVLSALDD